MVGRFCQKRRLAGTPTRPHPSVMARRTYLLIVNGTTNSISDTPVPGLFKQHPLQGIVSRLWNVIVIENATIQMAKRGPRIRIAKIPDIPSDLARVTVL